MLATELKPRSKASALGRKDIKQQSLNLKTLTLITLNRLTKTSHTNGPPEVDRIWLPVYYNKIPICHIFYLLWGDYTFCGATACFRTRLSGHMTQKKKSKTSWQFCALVSYQIAIAPTFQDHEALPQHCFFKSTPETRNPSQCGLPSPQQEPSALQLPGPRFRVRVNGTSETQQFFYLCQLRGCKVGLQLPKRYLGNS